jgi:ribosomal protein L11 methyltransferase
MAYRAVTFELAAAGAQAVSDALLEAGALSVDLSDAAAGTPAEQPVYDEPGGAAPAGWTRSRITALFDAGTDGAHRVRQALAALGLPVPELVLHRVDEQDWVRLTQQQFQPIRIGERIQVVPSWHELPEAPALALRVDPGRAFGSGAHPTTRLCLLWLDANIRGGERVIDYGCGSGILAIAAAKLGAGEVIGVDVEADAVEVSIANAAANAVQARFERADAGGAALAAADCVVANILARPLVALAPLLAALVRPGGRIALAGILAPQVEDVRAAYAPALALRVEAELEGWVLLTGSRR